MSQSIIEIQNLTRRFDKMAALDNVTLTVPEGGVFGLVGENGAGKSTLLKHVLGLLRAESGNVRVFGLDPVTDSVGVLGQIGYLSEDRDMPDWMRVGALMSYTSAFFPNWDQSFANELRDMFDLDLKQKVGSLSRGQKARVGLLLAIAHRPPLLVLDEPSSGLDPVVRRDILGAIIRTVADEGRTVLFSSHLLDEVQRVSDYVAMLHQGELVLSQPLDDVLQAHHRLVVRFAEPRDSKPDLQGALRCEGDGREWTVICNGHREDIEAQIASGNGEIIERSAPSLDEIFVARVNA
ncbi:MAG: ABC transporter ATP-binding protein [Planctomycetota bacterium]|jgi:ABC-2 type transport system ATP-binding protein